MIRASAMEPLEALPSPAPRASRGHHWTLDAEAHVATCDRPWCDARRFVRLAINDLGRLVATIEATGPEKCPKAPAPIAPRVCSSALGELHTPREWGGGAYFPKQSEAFADHVRGYRTCGHALHKGDAPRGVEVCRGWCVLVTGDAPACEVSL